MFYILTGLEHFQCIGGNVYFGVIESYMGIDEEVTLLYSSGEKWHMIKYLIMENQYYLLIILSIS